MSSEAYDAAVNVARAKHWYLAGQVPDSMDGRFAVLATVCALVTLRLEAVGETGNAGSIAMTEAFIADMDAQMREAGFGDPSLGKQVRHLVGSLAGRVDRWRALFAGDDEWDAVVRRSIYRDETVTDATLAHSVAEARGLNERLAATDLDAIVAGKWS